MFCFLGSSLLQEVTFTQRVPVFTTRGHFVQSVVRVRNLRLNGRCQRDVRHMPETQSVVTCGVPGCWIGR